MRGLVAFGVVFVIGCAMAGCADPNTKATHIGFGSTTDAVTMGPALRVVTERQRPLEDGSMLPTICSEPSPDVAVAFGRSLAASGSVTETGGTSGSGSVTATSTETATQLAGRTAGVLALRDGLYAACQSYVNGVLGHDAYALVLSQYGNLLVALAGTQTSGTPVGYTAQESATLGMMVACLSEYDPTRIRPLKPNGRPDLNPLLTPRGCSYLLSQIAKGGFLKPPAKTAAATTTKPKQTASASATATTTSPKAGQKITTSSETKTITENAGPPLQAVAATK